MMKVIIGLGNPGDKYINTRHNFGFIAIDEYAKKHLGSKIVWDTSNKFKSQLLEIDLSPNDAPDMRDFVNKMIPKLKIDPHLEKLILCKPQTYMNFSGRAVSALVKFYKLKPQDLIIVQDDLDLPLGKIRLRLGGAAGGHHGVESIIESLNDDKFIRVRLGIYPSQHIELGRQSKKTHLDTEEFVVEEFASNERSKLKHILKRAVEGLDILLSEGIEVAQNQFN